ncbi:MAG: hypothetical protein OHK0056_10590 [Bacteriovoracaceae bacterium]
MKYLEWIKKNRSYLYSLLPALIIGVGIGAYPGYRTYEYTWKDANFCISCHVHDYASNSWSESAHGQATTCHDCHHQPLHQYIKEAYVYVVKGPKFPQDLHHTPNVPSNLCQSCHVSSHSKATITGPMIDRDLSEIPKVDKLYLHAFHLKKKTKMKLLKNHAFSDEERKGHFVNPPPEEGQEERPISCSDCHGGPTNRSHHFSAVDLSCIRCHGDVHDTPMGREFGCKQCHFQEFLLPLQDSSL